MELNPIAAKRAKRLINYLKKEYKKNSDFVLDILPSSNPSVAIIKLTYTRFLDTGSRSEYDTMANELKGICEDRGEALNVVEGDSYFGGDFASWLIKPGKTVNCDALMSHIEIKLTYPMSTK